MEQAESIKVGGTPPEGNPSGLCKCDCGGRTKLAEATYTAKGWVKGQPIDYLPWHHNRMRKRAKEQCPQAVQRASMAYETSRTVEKIAKEIWLELIPEIEKRLGV